MASFFVPANIFDPPSLIYTSLTQPTKLLISLADYAFSLLRAPPVLESPSIRVVCISDTHDLKASEIPDGDLLIHAGDLTNAGTPADIQAQIDWLDGLPHQHKVAIAGNHDTWLDPRSRQTLSVTEKKEKVDWKGIWYLQHSSATLSFHNGARELRLYGAPQIPACGGPEHAFQYPRGTDAWSETVPRDTDVLVTHTPPKYHLDLPAALGCEHLLNEVYKVRPRLHVFGHIHAGKSDFMGRLKAGKEIIRWDGGPSIEKMLRRPNGLIRGLVDPRYWFDLASVVWHGIAAIVWERVWGGAGTVDATTMILASLMYCDSGKLLNPPQVVDI
ncbi:Hypothetical protein R9X50_00217700 [Acrodontium crateriforme]|uniref:Calcineurin-like phosphoesterase domain-containing protein n=1 Tax=Acrodontium crateriforme TaxID=150365 RepID=A0AAQ3M0R7_9PEZI|nr:Hypothetical protein R9X50_00217700 [Acrodontium crateriforme]